MFYNGKCFHFTMAYESPMAFEKKRHAQQSQIVG